MGVAEVIAVFRANTSDVTAKLGKLESDMARTTKAGGGNMEKMGKVASAAMAAVGTAAVAGAAAVVVMASKFEEAQKATEAAAKGAGTSYKAMEPQINTATSAMAKYGFTSTEVQGATASLLVSQGKHVPLLKDLQLAANIAAAKHIDLGTAVGLVEKAANGMTKPLKAMGIDLPIAAGGAVKVAAAQNKLSAAQDALNAYVAKYPGAADPASKAHAGYEKATDKVTAAQTTLANTQRAGAGILDALSARFGGQAQAAANTFGGKLKAAEAQGKNLGVQLGQKLIPILVTVMSVISKVVTWLEKHKTVATILAIAIGALIAGLVILNIVLWVLAANPVTLIVMAIVLALVALVAIVILVYTNWKTIWAAIRTVISAAWGFIDGIIHAIASGFVTAFNAVKNTVMTVINAVVGFFTALPGRVVGALGDIVSTIWGALTGTVSWIITNVEQPTVAWFTALPGKAVTALGDIVGTVWNALKNTAGWIYTNVELPVISWFTSLPGKAVGALGNIVGTIFGGLATAWTWIKTNVYDPIVTGFGKLPGDIGSAVGSALSGMAQIGTTIINEIIKGLNVVIDTVDTAIGHISFFGIGLPKHLIPDIPLLAEGGIVTRPTLAILGEAGPEAVIPLNGNHAPQRPAPVINITGFNLADPHQTAAQIGWLLR